MIDPNRRQAPSALTREEVDFKALQKKWYARLEAEGFIDIEDAESPREYLKTWHSNYFHHRYTPDAFQFKEAYYRKASQFLHTHSFSWFEGSTLVNWKEREIWRLHSEGRSVRSIATELTAKGTAMNKDQVHKVIVRLAELMKAFDDSYLLLEPYEEIFS